MFFCFLSFFHLCSLGDLGLERFSLAKLFTRILIPTSFLLVCILHLHYFHHRFLQLTDLQAIVAKEQSTIYRWDILCLFFLCVSKTSTTFCSFILLCLHSYFWITNKLLFWIKVWCPHREVVSTADNLLDLIQVALFFALQETLVLKVLRNGYLNLWENSASGH